MKDFFRKAAETVAIAFSTTLNISLLAGMAAINKLDDIVGDVTRRNNGINNKIETTSRININGLEGDISIPAPTRADKKWARQHKRAGTHEIDQLLKEEIAAGNNWRVLYLINRPAKSVFTSHYGFSGNLYLLSALHHAVEADNVTAAFLLLKFAEKNPSFGSIWENGNVVKKGPRYEELRDNEVYTMAIRLLQSSPAHNAYKVMTLALQTAGDLSKVYPDNRKASECLDLYLENGVADTINTGRLDTLEAFLAHGMRIQSLVNACKGSFGADPYRALGNSGTYIDAPKRAAFLDWLEQKQLVDTATLTDLRAGHQKEEVRLQELKDSGKHYEMRAHWRFGTGFHSPAAEYSYADDEKVVCTLHGMQQDGVKHVFNFASRRVEVDGQVINFDAFADKKLLEASQKIYETGKKLRKGQPTRGF